MRFDYALHYAARGAYFFSDCNKLFLWSEGSRNAASVRKPMGFQPIYRKSDRALSYRFSGKFGNLSNVICRWCLFYGTRTHNIETSGGMTDQSRDIDGRFALLDCVQILAEA